MVRGLPLIHDKTVDEWGTEVLGYFMTGPPANVPSVPGFVPGFSLIGNRAHRPGVLPLKGRERRKQGADENERGNDWRLDAKR